MLVTEHAAARGRAFDSLSYAKRMESVGFTRQQAETMAEEQAKLIDERLATKTDVAFLEEKLSDTRLALEAKIADTRLALEAKIADTKLALEAKIADTKLALEAKIEALRLESKTDLAETKADLIKWVVGIGFAQVAMILAVLKIHA